MHEIYHLVVEADFLERLDADAYLAADLERGGFVHCSFEQSVVPVANDYFAEAAGPLLLLRIDRRRLAAETRDEAPAPLEGAGTAHLESVTTFPHVYGPIDRVAIDAVGVMATTETGWAWPSELPSLATYEST